MAPLFFVISSIICLRSTTDLASTVCTDRDLSEISEEISCASIAITWKSAFLFNQLAWATAYFVGLQFTHLDHGVMQ